MQNTHYFAATSCATKDLAISGQVTWFKSSSKARRGFCGKCGSNLFWQPGDREKTSIFTGTINGDTGLKITQQIHVDYKGDYYDLPNVPNVGQTPIE